MPDCALHVSVVVPLLLKYSETCFSFSVISLVLFLNSDTALWWGCALSRSLRIAWNTGFFFKYEVATLVHPI